MTDADRQDFAELLAMLSETFNEPVSEMRSEGYFLALQDLPIATVAEAANIALRECKFFPRPVELRDFVRGNSDAEAELSLCGIHREIRRVGSWRPPDPSALGADTLAVIQQMFGGWEQCVHTLGTATGYELSAWEKKFKTLYITRCMESRALALTHQAAKALPK